MKNAHFLWMAAVLVGSAAVPARAAEPVRTPDWIAATALGLEIGDCTLRDTGQALTFEQRGSLDALRGDLVRLAQRSVPGIRRLDARLAAAYRDPKASPVRVKALSAELDRRMAALQRRRAAILDRAFDVLSPGQQAALSTLTACESPADVPEWLQQDTARSNG